MDWPHHRLRDRGKDVVAGTEPAGFDEQPGPVATTPGVESGGLATAGSTTPGSSSTTRIAIVLQAREFTAAKSAYIGDWTSGGDADTFAKWIASALNKHAERPAQQRAAGARPERTAPGRGITRSFDLPTDTTDRMREAIIDDRQVGRRVSLSDWCGDAVHAAVQEAQHRAGGVLPVPPTRLPNRLIRQPVTR